MISEYSEILVKIITQKVIEKLKEYEKLRIPIGISNRHIHLSQKHLDVLFGEGYNLTKKVDLKQPGQFASNETVTIRGPKGEFNNVRILGPVRNESQVEISRTDSFRLGLKALVRESGDLDGTSGIEIIGPKGVIKLPHGAIIALRHIHMTPEDAQTMGINDKDTVEVQICGQRSGVLGDVLVRVSPKYKLEMHVDMDEANAFDLKNNDSVIIKKQG